MIIEIVCTCIIDGRGVLKVYDPYCQYPVAFPNGQVFKHKDLGTASFDSPYDEVAGELLD